MGWFSSSSSSSSTSSTSSTSDDPLRKLDPALREFLEREAPKPPPASSDTSPSSPTPTTRRLLTPVPTQTSTEPQTQLTPPPTDPTTPLVPPQSLYQDGRYAHLWKNYRPLSAIESASKSDQEKLTDLVDAYNARKAQIGRAALENCALEQLALSDCFRTGSWVSRLTMCRAENQSLNRCYEMQGKFLKALGYLSVQGRSAEEEERIQMHADTLYHRMLEQERAVEEARREGRPVPEFRPVMSRENVARVLGVDPAGKGEGVRNDTPAETTATSSVALRMNMPAPKTPAREAVAVGERVDLSGLSEEMRRDLEKRLEGKSAEERALEERAIEAELAAEKVFAREIGGVLEEERRHRLERRAQGKETMGDTIKRWWGW